MGLQPDGGADLCQLPHPRPAQLEDLQCVQDPPRLHSTDILLVGGPPLCQDPRSAAAGRTLRPSRCPAQLCQGLGIEVQQAECRLLSLLDRGAPQASPEMRSHRRPPNNAPTGLFHSEHFYLRLNFWLSPSDSESRGEVPWKSCFSSPFHLTARRRCEPLCKT